MGSQDRSLGLSGSAVPLLRDLVHERTGIYFEESHIDMLADRLAPLVIERGFDSFLDYYYLLKYDEAAAEEWPRVMDALAVPETYFWREIDQIRALVDVIVPALVGTLAGRPLRIWSVPCASGEEPLTIAMVLEQAGWFERVADRDPRQRRSPAAIARARAGRYRERSFRSLPAALRERSTSARRGTPGRVDRRLCAARDVVERGQPDGRRNRWHRWRASPIVFCRNVFIYFSTQAIAPVVDGFADCDADARRICASARRSRCCGSPSRFELEEIGGAFVYVKR